MKEICSKKISAILYIHQCLTHVLTPMWCCNNSSSVLFPQACETPHLFNSMLSILNLALALLSMASGKILDQSGYFMLGIFFCSCACSKFACVSRCSMEKFRKISGKVWFTEIG